MSFYTGRLGLGLSRLAAFQLASDANYIYIPFDPDLFVVLLPDFLMDVTGQVFSIPNVEEVDVAISLTPHMELDVAPQEWDFKMTVN